MSGGTAGDCKVRIVRGGGFADAARRYQIFVNRINRGSLARNSVLELDVPEGPLSIEAQLDWGRSEPLMVTATPKQTIEIEVANNWGALLAVWAATFGRRTYLCLRQVNDK